MRRGKMPDVSLYGLSKASKLALLNMPKVTLDERYRSGKDQLGSSNPDRSDQAA